MKKPRNTNEETQFQPVRLLLGAMVMGSSRAIEHQEAQGQRELVNSESLPVRMNGGKPILESLGFKFGKHDGKDLFIECEMPTGWKKVGTDHSMWSNLLDDKGRVRANIFYKAAFYDRDAFMHLIGRYSVRKKYDNNGISTAVEVLDSNTSIYSIDIPPPLPENSDRETRLARYKEDDELVAKATAWITERYPDWNNPAAYWE